MFSHGGISGGRHGFLQDHAFLFQGMTSQAWKYDKEAPRVLTLLRLTRSGKICASVALLVCQHIGIKEVVGPQLSEEGMFNVQDLSSIAGTILS